MHLGVLAAAAIAAATGPQGSIATVAQLISSAIVVPFVDWLNSKQPPAFVKNLVALGVNFGGATGLSYGFKGGFDFTWVWQTFLEMAVLSGLLHNTRKIAK